MKETAARNGIFYGWFIVAAGAFALFMSMGARNGFGVFVVPMTDDLGWSRTEISAAIAVGILVNGLSQPFLGRLYDRFGGRSVISLSLLVLGISTILITFTSDFGLNFAPAISLPFLEIELSASLLFLILIYGLVMSTASSGVSLVTVHAVLAKWFVRRRGVVLSLCTAGTSLGGLILTPFAASLIIWTHWRVAWLVLGVLVLILALPLVGLLMRDKPEDMGEIPDGRGGETQPPAIFTMVWKVAWSFIQLIALPLVAAIWLVAFITRDKKDFVANPASTAPLESDSWKDSFRSPPIWQLSGAYFVCGVTTLIISTHYVPFAIDLGISPAVAAMAFGMMQGLNAVGVMVVGIHSDKFSRKNMLGTIYFIRFFAYVMLVTPSILSSLLGVGIPPSVGIWTFAYFAGMSWIATPPLTSSLTADIYGTRNLGTLGGFTTFAHQIGGSLSVIVAGVLYDVTGTYVIPFALAGLTLLGATIASYSVKERKFSVRYQRTQPAPSATPITQGAND